MRPSPRSTDCPAPNGKPSFTFLDGEVVYGRDPLRDFKDWDWGNKLAGAGIQRIEVERTMSRDEFEGFLQELDARLSRSSAPATSENRQMRSLGIRFGSVGVQGHVASKSTPAAPPALATLERCRSAKKSTRSAGCRARCSPNAAFR